MVFAPETFDPELVLEWLRKGEHRAAVRWLRQLSGASRQDCQDLVDRLEEAVFDHHPDPWRLASRLWPGVVAPLAGLPNPDWLEILEPQRADLLDKLLHQRSGAAIQLVAETIPCSPIEARRFLRLLNNGEKWDSTLETFTLGQIFPKPKPKPAPPKVLPPQPKAPEIKVEAPEPPAAVLEAAAAIVAAAPEFTGAAPTPSPWAEEREKERQAAAAARQKEREEAERARQNEREKSDRQRHAELEATDRARHQEQEKLEAARQPKLNLPPAATVTPVAAPPVPQKLDLNDTDQVIDRLTRLGEACAAQNSLEAMFILEELEQAGLNRDYVAARFPAMLPWLPDDPWSDQLEKVGVFAPILGKLLKGEVNAVELARQ
ncbi:MAG: hypothetical protein KIS61_20695, partial [Candidatus Eremiobacteraeota bacterium]|nr:hypothetical protein [Candidatus Eremiobacteraeota bacterium]